MHYMHPNLQEIFHQRRRYFIGRGGGIIATLLRSERDVSKLPFPFCVTRPSRPTIFAAQISGRGSKPGHTIQKTRACRVFCMVGVAGFEPTTSSSRTTRATKLRYTPMKLTEVIIAPWVKGRKCHLCYTGGDAW